MKSVFIVVILCLLSVPLLINAQSKKRYFYYDTVDRQTSKGLADYQIVYTPDSAGLYSFEKRKMSDDRLLMNGHCVSPDSESRTGSFVSYHENGTMKERGQYSNNKRVGLWKTYTDSSKLKEEGSYVEGKQEGLWKYYYENSKQLWYNVDMVADKRDGTLKSFYRNGKLKRIEQLDKGVTISGECYDKDGKDIEFTPFEQMPYTSYSIPLFLAANVHYPLKALDGYVQGKVYATFVVDKQGNVTKLKITKSLTKECDAEVMRVMRLMPKWVPGVMDDELVDVWYTQPVRFKLED